MEIFEVNLHTTGDNDCLRSVVGYPIKGNEVLSKGYGVTPHDTYSAALQFRKTAEFWGNEEKTPVYHDVLSFTKKTAPTAEKAMELTQEIFSAYLDDHLSLIGVHHKARGPSEFHTHTVISPTNYRNGKLMYADNSTLFPLAQHAADVMQETVRLVVKPEDKEKKEFHRLFYPHRRVDE